MTATTRRTKSRRGRVRYAPCGNCGKRGAHKVASDRRPFQLLYVQCRYCRVAIDLDPDYYPGGVRGEEWRRVRRDLEYAASKIGTGYPHTLHPAFMEPTARIAHELKAHGLEARDVAIVLTVIDDLVSEGIIEYEGSDDQ